MANSGNAIYEAVKGQIIEPVVNAAKDVMANLGNKLTADPNAPSLQDPISLQQEGIKSASEIASDRARQDAINKEIAAQKEPLPAALTTPSPAAATTTADSTKTTTLVQTGTGSKADVTPALPAPTPIVAPTVKTPEVKPETPFVTSPTGVITQEQMTKAMESPDAAKSFFSANYANLTVDERNALATRMAQNTNIQDLESARTQEGWDAAKANLVSVNQKIADFNATVDNVEADVRKDLGGEVTESAIQAEVQNRLRQLTPMANRLQREQAAAQANYSMVNDAVTQHFNAVRADAKEKVDQAMQKVDFSKDNINTSYSLMTGMKQYEITTDAQKSAERDSARAEVSLAIAAKNGLSRYTPQMLADLSERANLSPGLLAGIRDVQASGDMVYQSVDDSGAFVYAVNVPGKGLVTGRFNNFATVYQKVTSDSLAAAKDFSNASPEFKSQMYKESFALLKYFGNDPKTGQPFTVEEKTQGFGSAAANLMGVAAKSGNAADFQAAQSFLSAFKTPGQLTSDQFRSILQNMGG
jgi:hypothetical protein